MLWRIKSTGVSVVGGACFGSRGRLPPSLSTSVDILIVRTALDCWLGTCVTTFYLLQWLLCHVIKEVSLLDHEGTWDLHIPVSSEHRGSCLRQSWPPPSCAKIVNVNCLELCLFSPILYLYFAVDSRHIECQTCNGDSVVSAKVHKILIGYS